MALGLKVEHLAKMITGNKNVDDWHEALMEVLPKYDITTKRRVAHFVSQCAHESNNFRSLTENLNYSEKALNAVFGRYFGSSPKRNAAEYARNPEMIANYVYMDEFRKYKMGNVNEGDGWLFRGRGLKQLTGRDNYTRFGRYIGMSAEEAAEYVSTFSGAIESACWFWDTNNLNSIADTDDVTKMTRKINGGKIGLADRQERYAKCMAVLGEPKYQLDLDDPDDTDDEVDIEDIGVLRRGSRGPGVKMMQEALGLVGCDGIFGRGTEQVVKRWQRKQGLDADGVVGPKSLDILFD